MKNTRLLVSLAVLLAGSAVAGEVKFVLPPETAKFRPGPGVELAVAQCLVCHSADYINTQPRLARAAWSATVLKMQQKYGATIQTNSLDRLVNYLTTAYGTGTPTKRP